MPLFVCEECGCVDNTACGGTFWDVLSARSGKVLCCECRFGRWHNRFSKRTASQSEVEQIKKYWKSCLSSGDYNLVCKGNKSKVKNKV